MTTCQSSYSEHPVAPSAVTGNAYSNAKGETSHSGRVRCPRCGRELRCRIKHTRHAYIARIPRHNSAA